MAEPDASPVDGRFLLERKLGEGAFGLVFQARDQARSGARVVLKLLRGQLSGEEAHVERFRREVRALEEVVHPNVVALVAAGTCAQRGQPYYVMEWCEGVPLSEVLERSGPFAAPRALRLGGQVLDALVCAHARGIIHRDLKPENVLVERAGSPDEVARVIDFGLAKHLSGGTRTMAELTGRGVLGTPYYMAPEQCEGRAVGPPADIYSLGCLLLELLSGAPPFQAESALGVLSCHVLEEAPRLEERVANALPALADAIAACLRKDPAERPGGAALRALLTELHVDPQAGTAPVVAFRSASTEAFTASSSVVSGGTASLAFPPGGAAAGPPPSPPAAPGVVPRGKLQVEFEGQQATLFLFGGSELRFGRNRARGGRRENDLLLRAFPRGAEDRALVKKRTSRISGHHGTFLVSGGALAVRDDGSTRGSQLDGVALTPRQAVALPATFMLEVAGVLALRGRVVPTPDGSSVGALRLERTRDGEQHTYVFVLAGASLGSGPDDALQLPHPGVLPGHARLELHDGQWAVRALRAEAPVALEGRGPLAPGRVTVLREGDRLFLGTARLLYAAARDDDMIPSS